MKKQLAFVFMLIGWFAIIAQFVLLIENRVGSLLESCIQFFSYFTILTNIIVAIYFSYIALNRDNKHSFFHQPGTLTAICIYILIVGLVYQVALRHIWQPEGLHLIVDELLHSVIPLLVLLYWYLYEAKTNLLYNLVFYWAIYPLVYLAFILFRGKLSGFYPYPFIDVTTIGLTKTLLNAGLLLSLFLVIALLFIFLGKLIRKKGP